MLFLVAALVAACASAGCIPFSMGIATPIPVPPWVTERMEEKYCYDKDFKTPVLPPIREGLPAADVRGPAGRRPRPAGDGARHPRRALHL